MDIAVSGRQGSAERQSGTEHAGEFRNGGRVALGSSIVVSQS